MGHHPTCFRETAFISAEFASRDPLRSCLDCITKDWHEMTSLGASEIKGQLHSIMGEAKRHPYVICRHDGRKLCNKRDRAHWKKGMTQVYWSRHRACEPCAVFRHPGRVDAPSAARHQNISVFGRTPQNPSDWARRHDIGILIDVELVNVAIECGYSIICIYKTSEW